MSDFGFVSGYGRSSFSGTVGLTRPGSNNSKSAYTQIVASTSFDANLVLLSFRSSGPGAVPALMDLSVGAASSEVVVIPNILIYYCQGTDWYSDFAVFPVYIASGSRVSARWQNNSSSSSDLSVFMELLAAPFFRNLEFGTAVDWGSATGTSTGTSCGTTYTQLVASTGQATHALFIQTTANAAQEEDVTIGIGAGGSETDVFKFHVLTRPASGGQGPLYTLIPLSLPSGTRIAAKTSANTVFLSVIGIN